MVCSLHNNFWFAHGLHNASLLTVCTCLHILEVCARFVYQNMCLLIVCTFILKDHPWSPRGGSDSQRPPLVASDRASVPAQLCECTPPARIVARALPPSAREPPVRARCQWPGIAGLLRIGFKFEYINRIKFGSTGSCH